MSGALGLLEISGLTPSILALDALEKAAHVREVRFVIFDSETFTVYTHAARALATHLSLKVDPIHDT